MKKPAAVLDQPDEPARAHEPDRSTPAASRHTGRHRGALVALLALVLVAGTASVVLAALSTDAPAHHAAGPPPTRTAAAKVSDPIDLPAGYGTPEALTANGTTPGVWFVDSDDTSESVFFMNPTIGKLTQWTFATTADPLPYGQQVGIAVASSGTVWIGIDKMLVRLDPATGTLTRIPLPAVPTDVSLPGGPGGTGNVPRIFSTHQVAGLVAEPDGDLAIMMSWSTALILYDPAAEAFSTVVLPGGGVPSSLAALPSGQLVVAAKTVDLVDPDGSVEQTPAHAYELRCGAGSCARSAGGHQLTLLTLHQAPSAGTGESASSSSSGSTTTPTVSSISSQPITQDGLDLQGGTTSPTPLAGGDLLTPTVSGFAVVDPTTGAADSYTLAKAPCSSDGGITTSTTPTTGTCQEAPVSYVVDAAGNVWYTANFGTADVYELTAGDY